ncbi:hypothetical protein, partial [Escherichia coli]|uniref:hypothetical protein n=1 Tax=Escherichia coli TaxID=562 RepID=UPI001411C2AF
MILNQVHVDEFVVQLAVQAVRHLYNQAAISIVLLQVGDHSFPRATDITVMKHTSEQIADMVLIGHVLEVNHGVDE